MRALVLVVPILLAACGDGTGARLVSNDAGIGVDEGCVVTDGADANAPRVWKVREGDSLRRIARKVYGDEALWKAIREANPGKVGGDGTIRAGVELVIPRGGI